jgi:prophage antirepressor-like protein
MNALVNAIQFFNYQGKQIRTVLVEGIIWWVLKDVCGVLGIEKHRDVAARLDDDERGLVLVDTPGGKQEMIIVNEKGVNAVIMRSRKPEAKEFGRWFTAEGIPNSGILPSVNLHEADELQTFVNSEFGEVRTAIIKGKPHVAGVDIAQTLEYANPSKAVIDHCKNIVKLPMPSAKGFQETNMIPESDIYRLIFNAADQSQNPEIRAKAEGLQDWIFEEVLPEIRKTGRYGEDLTNEKLIANPDLIIELATALKVERAEKLKLEAENLQLARLNNGLDLEVESLKVELNDSERFWTIAKFNQHYKLGWDINECKRKGWAASKYSRQNNYEIRKCQTNDERFEATNSYLLEEVLKPLFLLVEVE